MFAAPMLAEPRTDVERVARLAKVSWLKASMVMEGQHEWFISPDERMRVKAAMARLKVAQGEVK